MVGEKGENPGWNNSQGLTNVEILRRSCPQECSLTSFLRYLAFFREYAFKEAGEWITLSCQVNDHFDVCEWTHSGRVKANKEVL